MAMSPLAFLLAARAAGADYSTAGGLSAVNVLASAAGMPLLSRVMDRRGQFRLLLTGSIACGAMNIVAGLLITHHLAVTFGLAACAGFLTPPVEPALRAVWAAALSSPDALIASRWLVVMQEFAYLAAPALVATVIATLDARIALVLSGGFTLLGGLAFSAWPVSRRWRAPAKVSDSSAWRPPPGISSSLITMGMLGIPLGALTIVAAAAADAAGRPSLAGDVLSAEGVGAVVGGLLLGRLFDRYELTLKPSGRLTGCLGGMTVVYAMLAITPAPGIIALCSAVAALPRPEVATQVFHRAEVAAGPARVSEAFGWVLTSFMVGYAGAADVGGVVQDAVGFRGPVVLGTLALATAAFLVYRREVRTIAAKAPQAAEHDDRGLVVSGDTR